jgi:hypothetical protein
LTTGIHDKYFEDQNLSLTQPARHREPLRRGGREIGQKGTFSKGLNLIGCAPQIVDQGGDVKEDKEDIQNQSRVGIIFITKFLNERE